MRSTTPGTRQMTTMSILQLVMLHERFETHTNNLSSNTEFCSLAACKRSISKVDFTECLKRCWLFAWKLSFRRILDLLYTRQFGGVHAFGNNSAKSEPVWMKYRVLRVHCRGLVLADFGRDPGISDSLRGSQNFLSGK